MNKVYLEYYSCSVEWMALRDRLIFKYFDRKKSVLIERKFQNEWKEIKNNKDRKIEKKTSKHEKERKKESKEVTHYNKRYLEENPH